MKAQRDYGFERIGVRFCLGPLATPVMHLHREALSWRPLAIRVRDEHTASVPACLLTAAIFILDKSHL